MISHIYTNHDYINTHIHIYIALSSHPKHTEWPQDAIRILNHTLLDKGEYAVYTAATRKLDGRLSVLRNGGVDVQGEIKLLKALRKRVHEVRIGHNYDLFMCVYTISPYCYDVSTLVLVYIILYVHIWYAHMISTIITPLLCSHYIPYMHYIHMRYYTILYTCYTVLCFTIPHTIHINIHTHILYTYLLLYTLHTIDLPLPRASRSLPLTIIQ